MTTITENDIKNALTALSDSFDKDSAKLYSKIAESHDYVPIDSPEHFHLRLVFPFERFLTVLIRTKYKGNSDLEFLLIQSAFVERHFEQIIHAKEGMTCCADKSRTIMNRLAKFFIDGTTIEFDPNSEYTYGYPKTTFTTHDRILTFFKALRSLYYGNPTLYAEALKTYE